jgi:hypothetical protein
VKVPENVTHIRFDPSVRNISEGAFSDCRDLVEVELNAGLLTIENCASHIVYHWCELRSHTTSPTFLVIYLSDAHH